MSAKEPDWDSKTAEQLARIAAVNSWHNGKAIKELKTFITIMFFMIAFGMHRIITGSWF